MAIAEVAVVCLSFVSCVGICAGVYYLAEQRKAQIQSDGVTKRLAMKQGMAEGSAAVPYSRDQWWVPLALKLLEVPGIQKMISDKITPEMIGGLIQQQVKEQ